MNDETHAKWQAYARSIADNLGLKDWRIEVQRNRPDSPGAGASFSAIMGRRYARIYLGHAFLAGTPEEQRHYMVHELLHAHTDDIDTAVYQGLEHIDCDAYRLMYATTKNRIEFAVDNLAVAISHAYPLP